jgi:hypothetical protein
MLLAMHVLLYERPVGYSELRESLRLTGKFGGPRTFDIYLKTMVSDGDLDEVKVQGSRRPHFQVSSRFFERNNEFARRLFPITEYGNELRRIEDDLERGHYGRRLGAKRRQRIISNGLIKAYQMYISLYLTLLRETTIFAGTYDGALNRFCAIKITDLFLGFCSKLRDNVPNRSLFGIANHDVWGWNQMYLGNHSYAIPKIIGSMWRSQKEWAKKFRRNEAEFRKHSRELSKPEMEFLDEVGKFDRLAKRLLSVFSELNLETGREPTSAEFLAKIRKKSWPNPDGALRLLIAEKFLVERPSGTITLSRKFKRLQKLSRLTVKTLLSPPRRARLRSPKDEKLTQKPPAS